MDARLGERLRALWLSQVHAVGDHRGAQADPGGVGDDVQDGRVQGGLAAHEVDELVAVVEPELPQRLDCIAQAEPSLLGGWHVLVVAELASDVAPQAKPQHAPPGEMAVTGPGDSRARWRVHTFALLSSLADGSPTGTAAGT